MELGPYVKDKSDFWPGSMDRLTEKAESNGYLAS
jgi:hypothetical protein